jgi:ABC-type metal ion transport system, periplasmic component/surface adhesin
MIKYVPALILFFLITTCAKSIEKSDKLNIFVSVLPQKYFVERIAGDNAEVHVMVLPGHNPATYEPTPSQMKKISRAELYFRIGVPFEEIWMKKLAQLNPELQIVDTREGITLRSMDSFITLQRQMAHQYNDGKKEDHDHSHQKDPHIWLSPELVKVQARTICKNLQLIDPENSGFYLKICKISWMISLLFSTISMSTCHSLNIKNFSFFILHGDILQTNYA